VSANVLRARVTPDDVAEKRPDRRVGGVTIALHERDECCEMGTHQAAACNLQGERRPARLSTGVTPVFGAGVLFDGQRRLFDIDLLDDARNRRVGPQGPAAIEAGMETWVSNRVIRSGGNG